MAALEDLGTMAEIIGQVVLERRADVPRQSKPRAFSSWMGSHEQSDFQSCPMSRDLT
jgi:hypothetical protein